MGRRKKEPRSAHRESIATAASKLFTEKGLEATSMDDIAKASGYSKATLYVYFENKEEIISVLVLESMEKLLACISSALEQQASAKEIYESICWGLVKYQEEFPFYFQSALNKINVDFESGLNLPEDEETYHAGEIINKKMIDFLTVGIIKKELRSDIQILPTIFTFWGMLSGLIMMAARKEIYFSKELKMSRQEFLSYGFTTLYRSIANVEL